mmetsp:Transcript_9923/g.8455  ORF Transcript_9923/g.8455 Transcript_9923/m.8455 type:complete len:109 (+) Transcript_9923:48-374(+)|eukprot:CAMPEP_0114592482 /NCGR_PEP_ID=MMETSP0125-20121206/14303_1 /TAXON_ID=485358 ORGANISM="Aristerostoma sp., Strain ATCC 50986" /NCGR_SAMPLE_ID=MMETSP0125 /ASSEMBLY_ACC=CAM_ASM_000245 /LENGTH=108 /DNA_ID=CAMNT_0001791159 /DNA_START=48 /DNA_END=374 /DNA_ORIENTATION=-
MNNSSMRQSGQVGSNQEVENAKAIARKLFDVFDKNNSQELENNEIGPMMQEAYKCMNRNFTPSRLDVESYAKVLDKNGDGRVTLADLEAICIKYLVGDQGGFNLGGNY